MNTMSTAAGGRFGLDVPERVSAAYPPGVKVAPTPADMGKTLASLLKL